MRLLKRPRHSCLKSRSRPAGSCSSVRTLVCATYMFMYMYMYTYMYTYMQIHGRLVQQREDIGV